MGTRQRPRANGTGGLWTIKRKRWNEAKQSFENVELYVRGKEVNDLAVPEGKRRWVTGSGRTPEEAEQRLQTALEKRGYKKGLQEAGIPSKRHTGSLRTEDFLLRWLSDLKTSPVSSTQILKYKQHLQNHIIPGIGGISLVSLGHRDLKVLFEETLPSKRKVVAGETTDTPLLGNNGMLNVYKTLNAALRVAVAEGLIERNPLAMIRPPKFTKPVENVPHFMHIILGIFRKMKIQNDPDLDHFLLAMLGLRRGERLGLAWKNVQLKGDNPTLILRQQLQRVSGLGIVIKPSTKSGVERRIALVPPFLDLLIRLKARRRELEALPTFKPSPEFEDLVFLDERGKPIDPNTDNDRWNDVLKRYKSPVHIRQHAIRHCSATYLSDLNVPESVVKSIFGFQSESMLHFYARQTSKKNRDELKRYGENLEAKHLS